MSKVICGINKMSKKIIIELEFDHEDTTREEIKLYLKDLIEDDSLNYEEVKNDQWSIGNAQR
jgi:hypothetical protein